ncbi:MAG: aconitase family protein [Saprospiraceae bacterium]
MERHPTSCNWSSSANPGIRDFWTVSEIVKEKMVSSSVSFDVNPTSRQLIENLAQTNAFFNLVKSGGRFHQSGCLGCIGMGQAPASGQISLRTMPRNFPGRSGTADDQVYFILPGNRCCFCTDRKNHRSS